MNQFDNTPIMPPSSGEPGPTGWVQTWIKAVTQPKEQTFIDISESPDAQTKTAYLWVFIASMLTFLISGVVNSIVQMILVGLGGQSGGGQSIGNLLIPIVCISPIYGVIFVLFFALGTAIVQWIAKLFGGTGTYNKLVYPVAAIYVPISLVSILLIRFNTIPFVGFCLIPISIAITLYFVFLQITAVKAVNRFGWGQAAGSVLLPGAVIVFVCGCIVAVGLMLMGPMIGNVFSSINQSLQFAP